MSSSQYEREFKYILEGENKILSKIIKTCTPIEKDNYLLIRDKPFVAIRAAGSFGIDLVAVRGNISFLIEIKTSIEDTLHFSSVGGRLQKQAESFIKLCEKTKTLPIYAFRLKSHRGDSWRIFTLNIKNLEGRLCVLHRRIPKLEQSNKGNFVMRWNKGLPLSDLILYLCR